MSTSPSTAHVSRRQPGVRSFRPKDGPLDGGTPPDDCGDPTVIFRGARRNRKHIEHVSFLRTRLRPKQARTEPLELPTGAQKHRSFAIERRGHGPKCGEIGVTSERKPTRSCSLCPVDAITLIRS